MDRISRRRSHLKISAICLAFGLLLDACTSVDPNLARMENTVVPVPAGEVSDVPAMALAQAMLKAGFTRQQILEHGIEVRNALATAGGAQVRRGNTVDAIFAVHSQELYVTSRTAGTFMQELFPDPPSASGCATKGVARCLKPSPGAAASSSPAPLPRPKPVS